MLGYSWRSNLGKVACLSCSALHFGDQIETSGSQNYQLAPLYSLLISSFADGLGRTCLAPRSRKEGCYHVMSAH
jgi:hypothetical protein